MEHQIQCPYCFEVLTVWLDPMSRGEMVRDCEVCCRPWLLRVERRGPGEPVRVYVQRAQ